jgi:hypothetical protein
VYDYLLLSSEKDVVATFNWDPFLVQTYRRHRGFSAATYCSHGASALACVTHVVGRPAGDVPEVRAAFRHHASSTRFDKDYASDGSSNRSEGAALVPRASLFLTIFGYSAPRTDAVVIDVRKKAWIRTARKVSHR